MADAAAKKPQAEQQPSSAPSTTPNVVASSSAAPSDEAAYKEYLSKFSSGKSNEKPAAPTVRKTGKNSYSASTPMQTTTVGSPASSSRPTKPLVVGEKSNEKPKEVKILNTSGKDAKKIGNKGIRIEKGVEFEAAEPLDYETWQALNQARKEAAQNNTGYQDYLNKNKQAQNQSTPLSFEDWLGEQNTAPATNPSPKPPPKKRAPRHARAGGSVAPNTKPEEPSAPENATPIPIENDADRQKRQEPNDTEAPTLNEFPNELDADDEPIELEKPTAERPPLSQIAPQKTLTPQNQAATAQNLSRQKALARNQRNKKVLPKNKNKSAQKQAAPAGPLGQAGQTASTPNKNPSTATAESKQQEAKKQMSKIENNINDIDNNLKKSTDNLKKPRRKLAALERKKRKLRRKLVFLKYFVRGLNAVLSPFGIGEIAEVPTEAGIIAIKKSIRASEKEIEKLKNEVSENISEEGSLITRRQESYREKGRLMQILSSQAAANDNGQAQPKQSSGTSRGTPWNDPGFDKNTIANDNSEAAPAQKAA